MTEAYEWMMVFFIRPEWWINLFSKKWWINLFSKKKNDRAEEWSIWKYMCQTSTGEAPLPATCCLVGRWFFCYFFGLFNYKHLGMVRKRMLYQIPIRNFPVLQNLILEHSMLVLHLSLLKGILGFKIFFRYTLIINFSYNKSWVATNKC